MTVGYNWIDIVIKIYLIFNYRYKWPKKGNTSNVRLDGCLYSLGVYKLGDIGILKLTRDQECGFPVVAAQA